MRAASMRSAIIFVLLSLGCGASLAGSSNAVTSADKREFIRLLEKLPTDGEFYADESIRKAAPHIAVLFALTPQDIGEMDIYPFAAVSRGLCDMPKYRQYGLEHFGNIAHPMLKLFWAAILFDGHSPVSSEVVVYLRAAIESEQQAKELAEIVGPKYRKFKKQVTEYDVPAR
jgi:hypothetical protein